ncbi:MAG TPA: PilZ domain-containing protein [Candidatus Omnitrophota bacterium]|nr:PilZ domain-containing protein [Candidatus Omnitrophota bacterium]
MKAVTKKEKRLYQRINSNLPVEIEANGFDFVTTTQNISCVGAYCRIDKYIPPFTRIMVKLRLPMANQQRKSDNQVACYGVIVRTDDELEGGFNIAVFFNEIKDSQRQKISQYLSKFLPKTPLLKL